jgi:hypothetical protein
MNFSEAKIVFWSVKIMPQQAAFVKANQAGTPRRRMGAITVSR